MNGPVDVCENRRAITRPTASDPENPHSRRASARRAIRYPFLRSFDELRIGKESVPTMRLLAQHVRDQPAVAQLAKIMPVLGIDDAAVDLSDVPPSRANSPSSSIQPKNLPLHVHTGRIDASSGLFFSCWTAQRSERAVERRSTQ